MYKVIASGNGNSLVAFGSFVQCLKMLRRASRWADQGTIFRPDGTNIRTESPIPFGLR